MLSLQYQRELVEIDNLEAILNHYRILNIFIITYVSMKAFLTCIKNGSRISEKWSRYFQIPTTADEKDSSNTVPCLTGRIGTLYKRMMQYMKIFIN